MAKKIVIALGGNALGNTVDEQREAVAHTAEVIVDLIAEGHDLIVTHGNGPQVGMIQNAMDALAATHHGSATYKCCYVTGIHCNRPSERNKIRA